MRPLLTSLALALLAALLPAAAGADSAAEIVGKLVGRQPKVEATSPGGPAAEIAPVTDIRLGTEVRTGKQAGALFTIGTRPPLRGMVKLGPESHVQFKQWLVDLTTGAVHEVGFFVQLGSFLTAFTPPSKAGVVVEPGVEKWIETRTVRRIRLEGTMVFVQVAADGTTWVVVIEGAATVESNAGGTVRLTAGTGTTVRPGQSPTPPAPADPGTAILALDRVPGEPSFGDPPLFDLRSLNLDLPKVDRP